MRIGYWWESQMERKTMSDIQRESQAVLNIIKGRDLHSVFEAWKKKSAITVYVPKETMLKEMAAKIE
jgi:Zn/Cd-binding protein ZinT